VGLEETTLNLIELIYDAAIDPKLWNMFLDRFTAAIRGTQSAIMVLDQERPSCNVGVTFGMNPEALRVYGEHFWKIDEWSKRGQVIARSGLVGDGRMLCTEEELLRSEFYNDYLRKFDQRHEIFGVIEQKGPSTAVVTVLRPQRSQVFDNSSIEVVQHLMPHLQRAVQLHRRNIALETEARTATSTLEHLYIGLIRLDRDARVLAMNRAAERIVAQRDGLTVTRAGLEAARAEETRQLRALISGASLGRQGITFGAGGAIPISRPSFKRPLSVVVSPAPAGGFQFPGVQGGAILFVTDTEAAIESDEEILKRLFGLTATEARIAGLLVQGRDLNGVCEELSIRRTTARSHLRHVFEKLGVRRQGELISLLLRTVGAVRVIQPPQ